MKVYRWVTAVLGFFGRFLKRRSLEPALYIPSPQTRPARLWVYGVPGMSYSSTSLSAERSATCFIRLRTLPAAAKHNTIRLLTPDGVLRKGAKHNSLCHITVCSTMHSQKEIDKTVYCRLSYMRWCTLGSGKTQQPVPSCTGRLYS